MTVRSSVRGGRAPRVVMVVAFVALAACGKKGPPLAPLRLVPGQVSDLTVRRVGPEVQLRFKLPTSNANGPGRIDLDHVEIYAVTVAPGSVTPPNRDSADEDLSGGNDSGQATAGRRRRPTGRRSSARHPSESRRRSLVRRGTDRSPDDAGSPAEGPIASGGGAGIAANHAAIGRGSTPRRPACAGDDDSPCGAGAAGAVTSRRSFGNDRWWDVTSGASGGRSRRRTTSCSGADRHRSHLCAARCVGEGPRGPAIGARDDRSRPAATTTGVGEDDIHRESGRGRVDAARE